MIASVFSLLLAAPASAPVVVPPAQENVSAMPDFAAVDSLDAAKALAAEGRLVPILLFPVEFGGEEIAVNTVYVTPEAAAARVLIIGTLLRMVEEGSVDQLEVTPIYKGRSFVPSRITMKAWHSGKGGSFAPAITVW